MANTSLENTSQQTRRWLSELHYSERDILWPRQPIPRTWSEGYERKSMVLFYDNIIRTVNNDLILPGEISRNTVETCVNHLEGLTSMTMSKMLSGGGGHEELLNEEDRELRHLLLRLKEVMIRFLGRVAEGEVEIEGKRLQDVEGLKDEIAKALRESGDSNHSEMDGMGGQADPKVKVEKTDI